MSGLSGSGEQGLEGRPLRLEVVSKGCAVQCVEGLSEGGAVGEKFSK